MSSPASVARTEDFATATAPTETGEMESQSPPRFLVKGTPAFRRASLALSMSGFSTFALLYCVQPLMPIFSEDFGVSPAASSLSLSLSTGFLAVAILCAAIVSERFGRRNLMFCSMLGASLCTIACALVSDWNMLLVIRAVEGILLGGVPAVAMAYLSEEIDPKSLGGAMGLYIAGNAFGGMAGRVVTGILAEYLSWRPALALMGCLGLAAAIGFFLLLPPSRNFAPRKSHIRYHAEAWVGHLKSPALPYLFVIGFVLMGAFVTIYNYAGFRLVQAPYDLGQTELGLIFTVYVFGIFGSWIAGILGDRFGQFVVLPIGISAELAGVLLTLGSGLPQIIIGIVLLTSGFFIAHSVASALVGRLARGTKGHASALYLLSYYLGSSVAGSIGGHFWSAAGWPGVVGFTATLLVIGLAAGFQARRLSKRAA